MASLASAALDAALGYVITNGTKLSLCSSEPANYAGISAVELAQDASVTVGSAGAGSPSGRKVTVPACDCVASADGDATHWALHDGSSILVATGVLAATVAITDTLTYSTDAFDITVLAAESA